jgi:hypothetical protein
MEITGHLNMMHQLHLFITYEIIYSVWDLMYYNYYLDLSADIGHLLFRIMTSKNLSIFST